MLEVVSLDLREPLFVSVVHVLASLGVGIQEELRGFLSAEDCVDSLEMLLVLLLLDGSFEGALILFYHLLYCTV